jgi:malate dehydrogenase (oxaloacetate-decarboxylating)(NADP+)
MFISITIIYHLSLGLGLGAILARATSVTDSMVEASSLGLADSLTEEEIASDLLYPRIERIREISAQIAMTVIRAAQNAVRISCTGPISRSPDICFAQGVDRSVALRNKTDTQLLEFVKSKMWQP